MRKIKILHISPDGSLYGTERHIMSIVKYLDKNKFENWVACPRYGNFTDKLNKNGVTAVIAGRIHGKKHSWQGFIESNGLWNLYRLIRKEKFNIVHTHLNSYGGFLAKLAGVDKVVHTRHGVFWSEDELSKISFLKKKFQTLKSKIFDVTVAIGEYEKNTLIKELGYVEEKIKVTYNGVSVNVIESKLNKDLNKKILFGTEDIVIGAVGRLERQKGFLYLFEAAKLVLDKIKEAKFVVIGDGRMKKELEELKEKLNLNNRLLLLDYKDNIYDYINSFDIMVQTSIWEGISYVVLEAMALGKPIVALTTERTSGVKEIIVHGKSGYLVYSDYINNLYKYLLELCQNLNKAKIMGEYGKERVKNIFSEEKTAKDMEDYYLELMSCNKA